MTHDPQKPAWRRALNKAQEVVTDPRVARSAAFGSKLLATLGSIKVAGPLTALGAAATVFDAVNQVQPRNPWEVLYRLAKREGLSGRDDILFRLLIAHDAISGEAVVQGTPNDGDVLAGFVGGQRVVFQRLSSGHINVNSCHVAKDFDDRRAAQVLWDTWGSSVQLTYDETLEDSSVTATPVDFAEDPDVTANLAVDPRNTVRVFRRYREAGINKAFLCVGPPGTGKTTHAALCAREMGGRLVAVLPEFVNQTGGNVDLARLVYALDPSVVLFEDVNHIQNGNLLSILDLTRAKNPDVLFLFSTNHPEQLDPALKRPSRMGQRLLFPAPEDDAARLKVVEFYRKKYNVERDLSFLAPLMAGFSHDYIKDVVQSAVLEDDDALREYVARVTEDLEEETVEQ